MNQIFDVIKASCQEIAYLIRINESEFLSSITTHTNQSGDEVKKLDELTNNLMLEKLQNCSQIRSIISEENEQLITTNYPEAPYLIAIDPLDGSSNIDVNITIGTIFTVFKLSGYGSNQLPQSGRDIVMAGYCLYGASTQLIVAKKEPKPQVEMFSLLPKYNDFLLVNSDLKIPEKGKIYAINESNKYRWHQTSSIKAFVDNLIERNYTQRWVASMVADVHRTLIKGGFFSYPSDSKNTKGRIRLVYEAYAMAFVIEQAGGKATNGQIPLLDVAFPDLIEIHQKTPIFLGSLEEMRLLDNNIRKTQ